MFGEVSEVERQHKPFPSAPILPLLALYAKRPPAFLKSTKQSCSWFALSTFPLSPHSSLVSPATPFSFILRLLLYNGKIWKNFSQSRKISLDPICKCFCCDIDQNCSFLNTGEGGGKKTEFCIFLIGNQTGRLLWDSLGEERKGPSFLLMPFGEADDHRLGIFHCEACSRGLLNLHWKCKLNWIFMWMCT